MLIVVDPTAPTPVFEQIAAEVATQIASGAIATGVRLPAARELADTLGVNVHTVLHAYQRLRDEGLVDLRRGRGAVVLVGPAVASVHAAVASVTAEARRAGVPLGTLLALIRKEYGA